VSLLVKFEKAKDCFDWEVGKHGIEIEFKKNGRHYSGTFLPEVAQEQGWDRKTTLEYLIQKAGYPMSLESVKEDIEMTRYQSIKRKMTFKEFKEL